MMKGRLSRLGAVLNTFHSNYIEKNNEKPETVDTCTYYYL